MRTRLVLVLAALAAGVGVAGATTTGTTLKLAYNKELKAKIIVDAKGYALYMWTADPRNASVCKAADECTKWWPPVIGPATVGAGLSPKLVRSFTRAGGEQQVTYNGHALYRFHGYTSVPPDRKPGQINGQGLFKVWYVLGANGKPIKRS